MKALSNDITLTDLFCGAGGSSSGAVSAGVTVQMAANHWPLAVETHNRNHQQADHDCADISATDPRRYPTTDLLWASPECTNQSSANGKRKPTKFRQGSFLDPDEPLPDEAADRSRATMWDVPRFAERHLYRYIVVENVVEARKWVMFDAWLHAMLALGYDHKIVYLNSMHAASPSDAPAPQSRDRMYCVFWQRGERAPDLRLRPDAWCPACDRQVAAVQEFKHLNQVLVRYRAQYFYRCPDCVGQVEPYVLPAAAAIDWALPGARIGDRDKPLADKTRARIAAGLRRYARPVHLEAAGNTYDAADPAHAQHGQPDAYMRVWPVQEPLRSLHTTASKALAYPPLLVPVEGRDGKAALPVDLPMRTATTRNETGLAVPPLLVPAGGTWNDQARSVDTPMRARTTRDTEAVVVPPFLTVHRSRDDDDHRTLPVDGPLPTVTASGNFLGYVIPPLLLPYKTNGRARPAGAEPMHTVSAAGNHHALVMRNNTARGDQGQMSTPVHEPLRTLTTTGHQSLIQWAALYGYDSGDLRSLARPLPTQTTVQGDALLTGALPEVDDCLFRMLEPHEIAAGMAFESTYVLLGNKREQVRLCGNAVTPPAAALLLERVLAALTGEQAAA